MGTEGHWDYPSGNYDEDSYHYHYPQEGDEQEYGDPQLAREGDEDYTATLPISDSTSHDNHYEDFYYDPTEHHHQEAHQEEYDEYVEYDEYHQEASQTATEDVAAVVTEFSRTAPHHHQPFSLVADSFCSVDSPTDKQKTRRRGGRGRDRSGNGSGVGYLDSDSDDCASSSSPLTPSRCQPTRTASTGSLLYATHSHFDDEDGDDDPYEINLPSGCRLPSRGGGGAGGGLRKTRSLTTGWS